MDVYNNFCHGQEDMCSLWSKIVFVQGIYFIIINFEWIIGSVRLAETVKDTEKAS